MIQRITGWMVLICGIAAGTVILSRAFKRKKTFRDSNGNIATLGILEVLVYFFATLGISDFLQNTLIFRYMKLGEDKLLPGTLIAAGLTPGAVISFSLLQVDNPVELKTLLLCSASIAAGGVLGAGLVGKIDAGKIKRVIGIALIGSMIALIIRIIVSAGAAGTATGLSTSQLLIAVPFSVLWGMLNMIGVPMKPAGTAFFLILGMSPLSTLTLVLTMAFIGPLSGGVIVIKNGVYHQKLCCAGTVCGSIGAVLGSLFAISISPVLLNILIICVMVIAIVSMFR